MPIVVWSVAWFGAIYFNLRFIYFIICFSFDHFGDVVIFGFFFEFDHFKYDTQSVYAYLEKREISLFFKT